MREGKFRLQIGALLLGVGLAFATAVPAFAQEVPGASVDADESVIETDDLVITADDPSTIEAAETRSDQEVFTDEFLDCVGDIGVSDAVTGVLENVFDEEEVTVTDETPYNPVDEGSLVESRVFDCEATPPGV
jgi:hypothetical protein